MNKTLSIEEGNKAIMFFDGAEESEINILGKTAKAIKYKDGYYPHDKPKEFHNDWNALMPACYKWDKLTDEILADGIWYEYERLCDLLDTKVTLYEILPVWQQLVENIEWLNSQSK